MDGLDLTSNWERNTKTGVSRLNYDDETRNYSYGDSQHFLLSLTEHTKYISKVHWAMGKLTARECVAGEY